MAKSKGTVILLLGLGATGIYFLTKGALTNIAIGAPQILVKGLNINSSGGSFQVEIQNVGSQQYVVNGVIANISDNGTRIATAKFLPGAGNPLIILPNDSVTLTLKIEIDPAGAISTVISTGQQILQSTQNASATISSINNAVGSIVSLITTAKGLFGGSPDNTPTDNSGNNSDNTNYTDNVDYGNDENIPDYTDTGNEYSNYDYLNPDGGDLFGGDFGLGGVSYNIVIDGVVNLSGVNVPFSSTVASSLS